MTKILSDTEFSPALLFAYANDIALKSEGSQVNYPSFAQCAEHFGVSIKRIEEACDEGVQDDYLGAVVGISNGRGIARIEKKRDYLVEAYRHVQT